MFKYILRSSSAADRVNSQILSYRKTTDSAATATYTVKTYTLTSRLPLQCCICSHLNDILKEVTRWKHCTTPNRRWSSSYTRCHSIRWRWWLSLWWSQIYNGSSFQQMAVNYTWLMVGWINQEHFTMVPTWWTGNRFTFDLKTDGSKPEID